MKRFVVLFMATTLLLGSPNAFPQFFSDEIPYSNSTGRMIVFFSEKRNRFRFLDISEKLGQCSDDEYHCMNSDAVIDISIPRAITKKNYPKTWVHLNRCFAVTEVSQVSKRERYFYIAGKTSCTEGQGREKTHTIYSDRRGVIYYEEVNDHDVLLRQYILSAEVGIMVR